LPSSDGYDLVVSVRHFRHGKLSGVDDHHLGINRHAPSLDLRDLIVVELLSPVLGWTLALLGQGKLTELHPFRRWLSSDLDHGSGLRSASGSST
jgi:hypothetical protein